MVPLAVPVPLPPPDPPPSALAAVELASDRPRATSTMAITLKLPTQKDPPCVSAAPTPSSTMQYTAIVAQTGRSRCYRQEFKFRYTCTGTLSERKWDNTPLLDVLDFSLALQTHFNHNRHNSKTKNCKRKQKKASKGTARLRHDIHGHVTQKAS